MSVYVVGGVVRDLLLGSITLDLDLAVEGNGIAFARLVAERFGAGLAVFERFATARLVLPNSLKMDIATTRRESYTKPAVLPVVHPASLEEDLYRRDFTINAMAIQLNPGSSVAYTIRMEGSAISGQTRSASYMKEVSRTIRPVFSARSASNRRFGFLLSRTTFYLLRKRPPPIWSSNSQVLDCRTKSYCSWVSAIR